MKHTIEVENIKCGGCMNSIRTAIMQMEGVQEVSIDKETETVIIEANSDVESFIQKLNDLGYPQKGNNSLLKKAKSYVSCAVGNLKS
ncbi:heavy-metal-associated domain-containing protein [Pseudopedobacter beijingensis]|uniref:Heavy-metal-associated domain-containing protein n=1 Tax=Pseudopedobacter beijingensis TaxID=1207056 RepID=A0ABW4IAM9_9SPHI